MSSQLGSEIGVRIFAETGELKPGMDGAANDVERASERMRTSVAGLKDAVSTHMSQMTNTVKAANDDMTGGFSSIAGAFGKVGVAMAAIGAILGGGAIFAAGVAESKKLTGEANGLAKALGISTTEASALNVALGDIYSSSETFIGASQALGRQLRTNEEGLNAMGLKTRDANGEYRNMKDLMMDGIKVLNGYKEGTDRNLAAQAMFGRGGAEVMSMLKLSNEVIDAAKQKQEELGLIVGVENVEAAKQYKAAMNDVDDVMSAIRKAIGDAVMPVLTKLGEWFSSIGPAAVTVIKGAVGGLIATFWALKNGVTIVWETINAMVVTVAEPIRALAAAIGKAITGDFSGAANEIKGIGGNIAGAWSQSLDEMLKSSEETSEKIANLFNRPTDTAAKESTGNSFVDPNPKDKKKAPGEKSQMPAWEAELARAKAEFMLKNDMYEMSLELEKKYWDDRLKTLEKGDKEYGAVEKKQADLSLQILKKKAQEGRALTQEEVEEKKRGLLYEVSLQEQAAEQAYQMGQISNEEILQLDRQFEQERYEIARAAIEERMALMAKDPNMNPVEYQKLKNQILEIDRRHALEKRAIENKIQQEAARPALNVFRTMETSFAGAITGMITRAQTLRQGLTEIFRSIVGEGINMTVRMAADWLRMEMMKTSATTAGVAARVGAEQSGAGQSLLLQAGTAIKTIMVNAYEAMAGAFKALVGIPVIGPVIAPAAAGAAFATVAGYASSIPSASGGFDIPSGINPITQLHEDEMVLPAKHANVIRSLADGGEGGGGSVHHHYHIKAFDGQDVKRVLMKHNVSVMEALKAADRNFVR